MVVLCTLVISTAICAEVVVPAMPMEMQYENTINKRWLDKPVSKSRLLDDMESLENWAHSGFGRMALTDQRAKDGQSSLCLTSPTVGDKPGPTKGRPFGSATARRRFTGDDWGQYNRLSFWVYPDLPGFRVVSLCLVLHNDGQEKVPDVYNRNGRNHVLVENQRWNHVVWEIAHLGRDKVTGVEFTYRLQGNEPGATSEVCFDIDHLELEKVEPDHFEGWSVAPGEIAFSHTGYPLNGSKYAIAGDLKAQQFSLMDAHTQKVVLTKPVETKDFRVGRFQILDFSQFNQPGTYFIKAGDIETRTFDIRDDIWRETIWKTINFFYCERCGTAISGIHDTCHRDWLCKHGDRQIPINGGWHDAGDLSQGLVNTSEATYAMFALAQTVQKSDAKLADRLIEEASWGLDWILKTRFGDGYRCNWATMDFWTDGIIGTVDDATADASNDAFGNFLAASAEAIGSQILKKGDPVRAGYCLQAAEEDWRFAMERVKNPNLEMAAAGLNVAMDLHEATGNQTYADAAYDFARVVLGCQQLDRPGWDVPLLGFFYTDPSKTRILHYSHRGHEQAPVVGLARLCEQFPDHPEWIDWYAAVVLYSEYYKTISEYTAPYHILPASIYAVDESNRPTFAEQVRNGIRLSEKYYLRLFPVWYDFRGNHGTVLSQTKGLSLAAHLRQDADLLELCQKQLQWVLGRNPFCQSTMYGEGYDYAPQYTTMSGDMVGSLPVGIQTHFERDVPYWPADNCYNYKEVWVHPSARWLWLMCDLFDSKIERPAEVSASQTTSEDGSISIQIKLPERARVDLAIRHWNLDPDQTKQALKDALAKGGQILTLKTKIVDGKKPWVLVILPGGRFEERIEVFGGLPKISNKVRAP
jgi:hypothetical protein